MFDWMNSLTAQAFALAALFAFFRVSSYAYFRWYLGLRTPEETSEWMHAHKLQRTLFALCVVLPSAAAGEEVAFRAPLLMAFDALTPSAWIGIVMFAAIFGIVHAAQTDWFEAQKKAGNLFATKFPRWLQRSIRGIGTMGGGVLFGYVAVSSQSLITSWVVHFIWNILAVSGIAALIIILILAIPMRIIWWCSERIASFRRRRRVTT